LHTKVKEEQRKLAINGKNYGTETHIAAAIGTMVTVNFGSETNIPMTLMHGRRRVNLI